MADVGGGEADAEEGLAVMQVKHLSTGKKAIHMRVCMSTAISRNLCSNAI